MSARDKRWNTRLTARVKGFYLWGMSRAGMVLVACLVFAGPAEAGEAEVRQGAFEAVFTERGPESSLQNIFKRMGASTWEVQHDWL